MSDPGPPVDDGGAHSLAAEYALGLLEGPEYQEARARSARDPDFAATVESWRTRLAPLFEEIAPAPPPADLWRRIEAELPQRGPQGRPRPVSSNDNARRPGAGAARWPFAALGAIAASVAWLAVLAAMQPVRPAPVLVASLAPSTASRPYWVATLDRASGEIRLTPGAAGPVNSRARELWLIPAGGRPLPLGVFAADHSGSMRMPRAILARTGPKAKLAVSLEPAGGSPTGAPTGPVIATGALAAI